MQLQTAEDSRFFRWMSRWWANHPPIIGRCSLSSVSGHGPISSVTRSPVSVKPMPSTWFACSPRWQPTRIVEAKTSRRKTTAVIVIVVIAMIVIAIIDILFYFKRPAQAKSNSLSIREKWHFLKMTSCKSRFKFEWNVECCASENVCVGIALVLSIFINWTTN